MVGVGAKLPADCKEAELAGVGKRALYRGESRNVGGKEDQIRR